MRIAVDAMGGDYAPGEIVAGCVAAARELAGIDELILVGDESAIEAELNKASARPANIRIVHASEVIGMDESPAVAIRRKKHSSILMATDLVKSGQADAVFSAGNTGAMVVAATLRLRTLAGVDRPAIAAVFPTPTNEFVLVDAGANTDCTPAMLAQFGAMGEVYARKILGVEKPRVGLLSIGEEDAKGNEATREAFKLLEASPMNFVGNVESRDLFEGRVDVVACDGFVGNVVLKTSEAVAKATFSWLKTELTRTTWRTFMAGMLRGAFMDAKKKADPETYGGAPLLGANGFVYIGHGSSSARAVRNALGVMARAIEIDVNHLIIDQVQALEPAV
ncbi:MAG: glycerol-3-phosphate acyltransferase PlsX [Kiritimatiellia bacterium]|jgi:glycerol-3-phosphate acyltransferase PlsX